MTRSLPLERLGVAYQWMGRIKGDIDQMRAALAEDWPELWGTACVVTDELARLDEAMREELDREQADG